MYTHTTQHSHHLRMVWMLWLFQLHFSFCVQVRPTVCSVMICVAKHDTRTRVCVCVCVLMHCTIRYTYINACRQHPVQVVVLPHPLHTHNTHTRCYNSKHHTLAVVCTHTCSLRVHTPPPRSVYIHLYKAVGCVSIDHAWPTSQDGRTPLMLAASAGHLQVAKHLVETYKCKVPEEDSEVSGWK